MTNLYEVKCMTRRAGELSLTEGEIYMLHSQVPERQVQKIRGMNRLERVFKFKNFVEALEFTNKIRQIGKEQDHHRLIVAEWGKVTVGTHPISIYEVASSSIMACKGRCGLPRYRVGNNLVAWPEAR